MSKKCGECVLLEGGLGTVMVLRSSFGGSRKVWSVHSIMNKRRESCRSCTQRGTEMPV